MSKDPTPRADALQAMREERYGHLQATAEPTVTVRKHQADGPGAIREIVSVDMTGGKSVFPPDAKAERLAELRKAAEQKSRPYAGKKSRGVAAKGSVPSPRKPRKPKGTKA